MKAGSVSGVRYMEGGTSMSVEVVEMGTEGGVRGEGKTQGTHPSADQPALLWTSVMM